MKNAIKADNFLFIFKFVPAFLYGGNGYKLFARGSGFYKKNDKVSLETTICFAMTMFISCLTNWKRLM